MLLLTSVADAFGLWIAAYFALAACASGLLLVAISTVIKKGISQPLRRACLWALVALGLGGICLVADLASPRDFLLTLTHFNPDSWIAWGSRILGLLAIFALVGLVFLPKEEDQKRPLFLAITLAVSALGLSLYPAFVLMQATGRPLWDHALLPLLFLASTLHLGFALSPHALGIRHAGKLSLALASIELLLLASFGASKFSLLFPSTSAVLWAASYLACGFLIPLGLQRPAQQSRSLSLVSAWLVLTGCFALRAWLLDAGQAAAAFLP